MAIDSPKIKEFVTTTENPVLNSVRKFMDAGEENIAKFRSVLSVQLDASETDVDRVMTAILEGRSRVPGAGYEDYEGKDGSDEGYKIEYQVSGFREGLTDKNGPENVTIYIENADGRVTLSDTAIEVTRPRYISGWGDFEFKKKEFVMEVPSDQSTGKWVDTEMK